SRILIALFAVVPAIACCWILIALMQLAKGLGGMGDNAVSEPVKLSSEAVLKILLLVGIWLVTMTAFILMFLNALNVLKGAMRCVAYCICYCFSSLRWEGRSFLPIITSFPLAGLAD
ncbi:MAG: hypothetical protein ACLPXB_06000, partial [Thiobacillaceae bacterium]